MTRIDSFSTGSVATEQPARGRRDWRLRLPLYYGWLVVAGTFAVLALTYAVWYSFSVFYVALLEDFDWSRAASAGVFSLFVVIWALGGTLAGALSDKWGPSRVMAAGVTILVAGLVGCSQVTQLWQFYLWYGVVSAFGVSLSSWIPCVTIVGRWFSARVGAALGVTSSGIGMGIFVMVPLSQWLISNLGWRTAYLVLAGLVFSGVLPLALVVLRHGPQDLGLTVDGKSAPALSSEQVASKKPRVVDQEWANREWTVAAAARTRRYWLVFGMLVLNNIATQMIFVHQVAFLVDGGYDKMLAAAVVGLIGLLSIAAKIGWGWVSDWVGREATYTVGLSMLVLATALLIGTQMVRLPWLVYAFAFAFALGYGVATPLGPAVGADLFAGRRFGSIYGTLGFGNGIGSALGAWSAGYVFDITGSYLLAFSVAAVSSTLSITAIWLAAPRKVRRVPGRC